MRNVSAALLESRLEGGGASALDAGCGSGGFIAWLSENWVFDRLCGVDLSPGAIELARQVCPGAELHVAPLHELPFEDAEFDLVIANDVLQHVDDELVVPSLQELRRVLRANGTLLVRTNAARHARRVRRDWRVYDEQLLRGELQQAGFKGPSDDTRERAARRGRVALRPRSCRADRYHLRNPFGVRAASRRSRPGRSRSRGSLRPQGSPRTVRTHALRARRG